MRFVLMAFALLCCGKAFALGIDIGPLHLHGTKVKIGTSMEFKVIPSNVVTDEDDKERVRRVNAVRVNSDEKLDIKVTWADLDDESKSILKSIKTDSSYKVKLERLVDEWKLLKIRRD